MGMENKARKRILIMGILNVTPDSFYDGGKYLSAESAVRHAEELVKEGAGIIDVGGESTKPGSAPVSLDVELERVIPVIEKLADRIKVPISIDTQKAEVARQALNVGAGMVNDISALRADPQMVNVAREHDVPVVLMHMKGTPKDMQENPYYDDVINEIKQFFRERIEFAKVNGIREENIIIDPGIGFGKRVEDNLKILRRLGEFKEFGRPILVGPSRKSFIGGAKEDRIWGTAGAVSVAVMNGADIIRVHDVAEMRQVVEVVNRIMCEVQPRTASVRGCTSHI